MSDHRNLLAEPPPTRLPDLPEAREQLATGTDPADVAARFPTYSAAWAALADRAYTAGRPIESYAYARTGYHRGLDQLRGAGWKGHGPIPWDHLPNRGFLSALNALARAAESIGELDEAHRCRTFLRESSAEAAEELEARGLTPGSGVPADSAAEVAPSNRAAAGEGAAHRSTAGQGAPERPTPGPPGEG